MPIAIFSVNARGSGGRTPGFLHWRDVGGDKVKALCVATRCTTLEQFISTFCRYCDQDSFFVATLAMRPAGLETPFSIQLVNRTPVLRGTCVVLEAWSTGENPFKRPGIR